MEEKIGMLIELANEYEIEREKSEGVNVDAYVEFEWEWTGEGYLNKGLTRFDRTDQWEGDNLYKDVAVAYLISKSYGFIKWLVENEKIDYEKIEKQTKCKNIVGGKEFLDFDIERDFTPYEEVLMWLTIQDEPINFLISILK